jgi:protein DGCR14
MLASPGHSPRHILPPPSPSPSIRSLDSSKGHASSLALVSTSGKITGRPPLPKKRKRSQVAIDEDTYVAAIEKIIERDFFPDIPKLQNRLEWLEAVRSGDPVVIRDAQLNIIQRRREKAREQGERDATPASTVAEPFGTPSSMISGVASPSLSLRSGQSPAPSQVLLSQLASSSSLENEPNVDTSLPLDEFLKRYTSEDNASFSEIIEKVNKQRRQKYKFLSEKELVDPNHRIADEADRITDGFGTSGQPEATLQTWNYRARNLLMYDSAEREDAPLTQAEREELMEGAPKEIAIRNTRFHGKMFDSKLRMEDTVAILYTPVPGSTPTAWPFAERDAERARGRYDLEDLRKTPQVLDDGEMAKASKGAGGTGGYSFVATPSPRPGVDESPFMTWGEIEGTPLRLEAEDTPVGIGGNGKGPHFKIPAPPTRDARAHTLSRDAARSLREKSLMHNPGLSPSPARGASSPAMGSLSAAAQKFVSKAMAKSCATVDARLRASYRASTMPGTPRMARNAVRSREGSVASRESSVPLRSPSIFPS